MLERTLLPSWYGPVGGGGRRRVPVCGSGAWGRGVCGKEAHNPQALSPDPKEAP